MNVMHWIILALATWRLSSMLSREDGPLYIFRKIRYIAGVRYDEFGSVIAESNLAQGVTCLWCNSVWFATVLTGSYLAFGLIVVYLSIPLALSAIAIAFDEKCV